MSVSRAESANDSMKPPRTDFHAKKQNVEGMIKACVDLAGKTYTVPSAVLTGLYTVEGGKIGDELRQEKGNVLLGPMQVDSSEIPFFAHLWGVSEDKAYEWVKDDPCTNFGIIAWKIRLFLNETGSLDQSIEKLGENKGRDGKAYREALLTAIKVGHLDQEPNKSQSDWVLLIYDYDTLIKNPKPMPNLKSCLAEVRRVESINRSFSIRNLCQNNKTGALYAGTGLIRKAWDKDLPKDFQMGRKAPWLD